MCSLFEPATPGTCHTLLGGRWSAGILRLFSGGDLSELLIPSLPASVLKPRSASEDSLKGTLRLPEPRLASRGLQGTSLSAPAGSLFPPTGPLYSASPSRHTGSVCKACQLEISSREQGFLAKGVGKNP